MKKVVKCLLLFTLCFLLLFNSTSFAGSTIYSYFSGSGKDNLDMETVTSGVYGFLYTCGVILAVCILVTIAISYMVATPNKRAILKERLIYYFIGVIFLVGGLAFLRIYEKAAKDVGSIVYNGGSSVVPSKWDTDGDGKFSQKEMHDNVSYDELDEIAQDAIDEGIENLTDAEIQLLITRLAGISDGEMEELDLSKLLENYDDLTKEQQRAIMEEGKLCNDSAYRWGSDFYDEAYPAELMLSDFYAYKSGKDGKEHNLGYTDEQWEEDEWVIERHKWYYENVYLKYKNER